ncbi:L,D-transpeptidase family protein [uncultured Rhodoblastus sp.]|uniref:L,D-transpeptidase family protein n=1 Tax=uncultured Rhodoblastus sp. TaxID=543037 RepID=UPI0025F97A3A|nr:L,D-transpeptidase family protein [uncultured Rhodoblastus sp.]
MAAPVAVSRAQEAATPAPALAPVETPAPAGELQAPEKPSFNRAIRAALIRAAGETSRANPQTRARRQALDAWYASRGDAPVWLEKGEWTPNARAAFERLQRAPEDGLDLSAWRVYALERGPEASLALADVALSEAVAAYAFQASGGRLDPARISRLIGAHPTVVGPAQALDETSQAPDADRALRAFNPDQPGYLALREKLAQRRAGLAPTALLASTEPPRRASDASGARRGGNGALESDLLVNMEFWRWQPREPGADRLVVNIPEFEARLYRADAEILTTRVIVGKPDKATPLFSNRLEYLIVNPSWNVPQSIIKNEMMNKLGSLRRMGYDVDYVDGRLHVRQPPGERNALGRIKFIFPNDYAVYLHDTPTRGLFAASSRAFSHGCVRVDQPFSLAVALLRPERGWSEERLKKMLGKNERRVSLPEPLPIHLVYFTVRADESGQLQRFEDIYGYAGKARQLLGLGG